MTVFAGDRELTECWERLGAVPENHSTREYAARLCARLLADLDKANALVSELCDLLPDAASNAPFLGGAFDGAARLHNNSVRDDSAAPELPGPDGAVTYERTP